MEFALTDAATRVLNQLGPMHRECVYAKALAAELAARGHHVSVEHPVVVSYTASDGYACVVATERADIVVDTKVVVEVKVAHSVSDAAMLQAGRYATTLKYDVGFVVAFSRQNHINLRSI